MPKLIGFGLSSVPGVDDARDAFNSVTRVGIAGTQAAKMDPNAPHGASWFTLSVLPFLNLDTTLNGSSLMGALTSLPSISASFVSVAQETSSGNGNALKVVNAALNLGYAVLFFPVPGSSGGYSYGFIFASSQALAYQIASTGDVGSSVLVLANPIIYGEPPIYRVAMTTKKNSLFSFVEGGPAVPTVPDDKKKWLGAAGILVGAVVVLLIMTND